MLRAGPHFSPGFWRNRSLPDPYTRVMTVRYAAASALACAVLIAVTPASALEEAERDRRLQPGRVMDAVGVRPGMVVGEVGAGRGYFTVKLARRVGPDGRVFANDIDGDALAELEQRCHDENLHNVVTVEGEVDDPLLPERALDVVFLVYALHHIAHQVALLRKLEPSLAEGAVVVVLDEDPEATENHHFPSRQRVHDLFVEAGYEQVPLEEFLERDLLLAFRVASR
jgi:SAM-dependent methyltransferase